MKWTVHAERPVYESDWVSVTLVDLEIPGRDRFEHHVIRMPANASGVVVHDPDRGVLMLWRHRFITDTWGWEIPAGRIDAGEDPAEAAAREVLEETGWRPGPLRPLVSYHPTNGLSDLVFHLFVADGATHEGDPTDPEESERIEWVPTSDLRQLIASGALHDGLTMTGVLAALALDYLD